MTRRWRVLLALAVVAVSTPAASARAATDVGKDTSVDITSQVAAIIDNESSARSMGLPWPLPSIVRGPLHPVVAFTEKAAPDGAVPKGVTVDELLVSGALTRGEDLAAFSTASGTPIGVVRMQSDRLVGLDSRHDVAAALTSVPPGTRLLEDGSIAAVYSIDSAGVRLAPLVSLLGTAVVTPAELWAGIRRHGGNGGSRPPSAPNGNGWVLPIAAIVVLIGGAGAIRVWRRPKVGGVPQT